VAEAIGIIKTVSQNVHDRRYYDGDDIRIRGVLPDGREFVLELEVKDKKESPDAS
jgi:hypothetical protein